MILLQVPTTGASAVDSTAAATPAQSMQLFDLVAKGGWVMIPISLLFFLALYMIIERWLFIRSNTKVDDNFIDNVKDMVLQGNIKSAESFCKNQRNSIGRIFEKAIGRKPGCQDQNSDGAGWKSGNARNGGPHDGHERLSLQSVRVGASQPVGYCRSH